MIVLSIGGGDVAQFADNMYWFSYFSILIVTDGGMGRAQGDSDKCAIGSWHQCIIIVITVVAIDFVNNREVGKR